MAKGPAGPPEGFTYPPPAEPKAPCGLTIDQHGYPCVAMMKPQGMLAATSHIPLNRLQGAVNALMYHHLLKWVSVAVSIKIT